MTRDEIISMAHEAGSVYATDTGFFTLSINQLQHFASRVVAKEHGSNYASDSRTSLMRADLQELEGLCNDLLQSLEYAISQVPELGTVPGIAATIGKAKSEYRVLESDPINYDEIADQLLSQVERGEPHIAPYPPTDEPIAWLDPCTKTIITTDYDDYGEYGIPLYIVPYPHKPLSNDDIDAALHKAGIPELPAEFQWIEYEIARAIERAHNIGEP